MTQIVITYGTFDLFHIGHLRLLKRARSLGSKLIVGVSTDDFNKKKGKISAIPYADRCEILSSLICVDDIIPEHSWEQKEKDIIDTNAKFFCMGDDWVGQFDHLRYLCEVIYLSRTPDVSSTLIKDHVFRIKQSA